MVESHASHSGTLLGTLRDQAIALAGALAQAGVQRLVMQSTTGESGSLLPRFTDLPAILLAAPPGTTLASPEHGFAVALTPSGTGSRTSVPDASFCWITSHARLAELLAAVSAPSAPLPATPDR